MIVLVFVIFLLGGGGVEGEVGMSTVWMFIKVF